MCIPLDQNSNFRDGPYRNIDTYTQKYTHIVIATLSEGERKPKYPSVDE